MEGEMSVSERQDGSRDVKSQRPLPSGPRGSLLMGSLREYNADPLAFMANTARQYGDFVPLRLGPIRGVLLSDPKQIESLLVQHHKSVHKSRGVHRLATLLGNGIFISEGDDWLHHRRLMQPAFHRASVDRYADVMARRISAALDRWATSEVIDVVVEMRRLALEIAAESLFGNDVSAAEASEIREAIEAAGAQLQTRVSSWLMFVPDWVPTPGNRRMNAAIARLDGIVYRIIAERRRHPTERVDLLSLLLSASNSPDGAMSDKELRDEGITLLVAGHETTALTLAWALYEIARHPDVDAALDEEVKRVLGSDRAPTPEDFPNLSVTSNIVNETLRLYPAGYLTAREAIEDIEIDGHVIRKGSLVLMSQWEQQRDASVFDDADEFRPDRWSARLQKELARGDFFPFGMGPRMCIGGSFANLELMLAIAMIRQRYRLQTTSAEIPRPVPIVTLNPDRPISLRLTSAQTAK
jgi:cytochrome P450